MTIKQKQNLLAYLGYYLGEVDGKWGGQSKGAVIAFQDDYGLTVDGLCGPKTEAALKDAVYNGMPEKTAYLWDGVKYFKREEFRCKCGKYCNGYPVEMKEKLIRVADRMREHFDAPVRVSSGARCEKHNANVGGVEHSRHKYGKAMDFCVQGFSAASVLDWVKAQKDIRYCYAIDSNYVHMDVE